MWLEIMEGCGSTVAMIHTVCLAADSTSAGVFEIASHYASTLVPGAEGVDRILVTTNYWIILQFTTRLAQPGSLPRIDMHL